MVDNVLCLVYVQKSNCGQVHEIIFTDMVLNGICFIAWWIRTSYLTFSLYFCSCAYSVIDTVVESRGNTCKLVRMYRFLMLTRTTERNAVIVLLESTSDCHPYNVIIYAQTYCVNPPPPPTHTHTHTHTHKVTLLDVLKLYYIIFQSGGSNILPFSNQYQLINSDHDILFSYSNET